MRLLKSFILVSLTVFVEPNSGGMRPEQCTFDDNCLGPLCPDGACWGTDGPHRAFLQRARMKVLSSEHRIYTIDNFLTPKEVKAMTVMGEIGMEMDEARGPDWRKDIIYGRTFLQQENKYLKAFDERVELLTGIPPHEDETVTMFSWQTPHPAATEAVLTNVHHDKNGRPNRSVTVFVYLSKAKNDRDGGHTIFPALPAVRDEDGGEGGEGGEGGQDIIAKIRPAYAKAFNKGKLKLDKDSKWGKNLLKLAKKECKLARIEQSNCLTVKPKVGMALVFYSEDPDGDTNPIMWNALCLIRNGPPHMAVQKYKEPEIED